MSDIEDRIRKLEQFRYRMLGVANAHETMILDLWMQIIEKVPDPALTAQQMQSLWLKRAEMPKPFPGIDPVHLEVVAQEYAEALRRMTDHLLMLAQAEAARSSRQRRD